MKKTLKKKRQHVLWTRKETHILQEELYKRSPIREIAVLLKKSQKAIRSKCAWLGVSSSTTYRPRKSSRQVEGNNQSEESPGGFPHLDSKEQKSF